MDTNRSGVPEPSGRLRDLPGYGRGRAQAAQVFAHRLGSNEAPDGPSAAVQSAVAAAFAEAHRYPDLRGEALAEALARQHGVGMDHIAVSAGSIVLLDQVIRAWCDPGDDVVTPWRSYEAYPIIVGLAGARMVGVPLDDGHRLDAAALCAAVTPRTRVALICNPNNPTGTALSPAELDALLAALPERVLVVLDEAYCDYSVDAQSAAASPAARLARHPNLVILRTFSKAWGLAGLRLGYAIATPRIVAAIHAAAPPFPLPGVALAAGIAALADEDAVAARVACNATERTRLSAGLAKAGLPVAQSAANFVWLPVGRKAEALTAHLRAASIAIRCFPGEGVRITTGTPADSDAVLEAVAHWRPND